MADRHGPGIGAEITGAGEFGPPGRQDDPDWRGWWGDDPPFQTPMFVLTHRPRPPTELESGTTVHVIDATPVAAHAVAHDAVDGQDVRVGGGPTMPRSFLADGLVDHLRVVVVPIVLGPASASRTGWRPSSTSTTSRWSPPVPRTSRSPCDVVRVGSATIAGARPVVDAVG